MYSTSSATVSRRARPSSSRATAEEVPILLNSATMASLEHGHMNMMADSNANTQLSSDDDVHISLGIQQGLERVWSTALSKVGAMSLAWQNETELAPQPKTAKEIDPALVFDGMHAASNSRGSKDYTPVVSVHGTDQAYGDQEPWSSNRDDVRNILETTPQTLGPHAWTAKHRKSTSISTLTKAAKVARRTNDYLANQKNSLHPHSQRLSPLAATRVGSCVARADGNTKRPHRMSIRLERLLPHPKTPESASIAKAILISPRLNRNRKVLNRLRPFETKNPLLAAKGIVDNAVLHRRTSSLPNLPKSDFGQSDLTNTNEGIVNKTSRPSVHQRDGSLSSLEGQVSNMFTELGICSPYTDASRQVIADQQSNPSNSPYKPDPNMWFYQPEYTKDAAGLMGSRQERPYIMLIDDDSSCAENSADYATLKHQSPSYKSTGMGSSAIISTRPLLRRRDTTSTNSTVLENAVPTTSDYPSSKAESAVHTYTNCQQVDPGMNIIDHNCLSQLTVPSDGVCTACRDKRKTCCQMQLVLRRIEQAGQYAQNASRRALAADTLLADLRAQSRLLSDTLLLSQKRASAINNTLAGAIDAALGMTVTNIDQSLEPPNSARMDVHSKIRVNENLNRLSKKMHTLKKRTISLDVRAKAIGALRIDNGLDAICAAKTHVHSWLDTNVTSNTRITVPALESEVELEKEMRKSKTDGLNSIYAVSGSTNMTMSTDATKRMCRRRRPVQPISIRIQRISNQWDELQSLISELGISGFEKCKPLDGADMQGFQLASKVTADGLKLIQQILKTTHDALNAVRSPPNTPNT